ncbi:MAG: ferredoxin [Frankiales bacterium]|nr:ferredoxin [Frankiales bacterium]
MKLYADNDRCQANALCSSVDPDMFTLDDDGYIDIGGSKQIAAGQEETARKGVTICPAQALRIGD